MNLDRRSFLGAIALAGTTRPGFAAPDQPVTVDRLDRIAQAPVLQIVHPGFWKFPARLGEGSA
ncbi:hypothetical protein [Tautonia plasticadhaerens]|uniref:hypothetical protein n=1 Tax=Tautonia plasticadhaerens TaxID=2527974 RepID=UPI0011A180C9|nr:hypothetical protein [Tautonia plasticadhaerens]